MVGLYAFARGSSNLSFGSGIHVLMYMGFVLVDISGELFLDFVQWLPFEVYPWLKILGFWLSNVK